MSPQGGCNKSAEAKKQIKRKSKARFVDQIGMNKTSICYRNSKHGEVRVKE